jgi:hypothetical protein
MKVNKHNRRKGPWNRRKLAGADGKVGTMVVVPAIYEDLVRIYPHFFQRFPQNMMGRW